MTDPTVPPPIVARKNKGCCLGCSIGCLVALLLLGILGYLGGQFLYKQYQAVMERFEREGYHRVEGQVLEITEPPSEPTIYVGQVVRLHAGSTRGVAMVCQAGEIEGTVEGNVHFYGQMLTVHTNAHLMRDLNIVGQVANVYGQVDGEVKGSYQVLNRPRARE